MTYHIVGMSQIKEYLVEAETPEKWCPEYALDVTPDGVDLERKWHEVLGKSK